MTKLGVLVLGLLVGGAAVFVYYSQIQAQVSPVVSEAKQQAACYVTCMEKR